MQAQHALPAPRFRTSAPTLPRLSRRVGFWAIAFSFLTVTALSTAPSALYGLYARHEHLAPITITAAKKNRHRAPPRVVGMSFTLALRHGWWG